MTEHRKGLLITVEGVDGSGKTTQMHRAAEWLRAGGYQAVETVEPGGTETGRQIRAILLDPRNQALSPTAEMLLYFAARAQNVDEIINPSLAAGRIVLCDRFTDSTLAYQGAGRGLGEDVVLQLDRIACRGRKPDLTLVFDLEVEAGLERVGRRSLRNRSADRMDRQAVDFHQRVRAEYLRLAAREPRRVRVIEATGSIDEVAARVCGILATELTARLSRV